MQLIATYRHDHSVWKDNWWTQWTGM